MWRVSRTFSDSGHGSIGIQYKSTWLSFGAQKIVVIKRGWEIPEVNSLEMEMFHDFSGYPLVNIQKAMENHHFYIGQSTISTGPFSIAMLN
jgi:hypothetical protein